MTETLDLLDDLQPDVAIVDIQLKHCDGLELVRRLKARYESVAVLIWSVYPDKIYAGR